MNLDDLRRNAIGWTLRDGDLSGVFADLDFVQADPIQAPARAQDLILAQRVPGYRAGDLDARYPELGLDEDYFYVYGFVTPRLRGLLHPRQHRAAGGGRYVVKGQAAAVLEFVRGRGVTHPRDVQAEFGKERVVNDWGGRSVGTTVLLEQLQLHGLLRVARREAGVRLYEAAPRLGRGLSPQRRVRELLLRATRSLAPISLRSLGTTVSQLGWTVGQLIRSAAGGTGQAAVRRLIAAGDLVAAEVAGERYVWPADLVPVAAEAPDRVRILAPFDPLVWDRRRFEHLWGWAYRFEAYTPAAKRRLGYYAMPLLWRDRMIGWVNGTRDGAVDLGYVDKRPRERAFGTALDAEIARLRAFLGVHTES